MGNGVGQDEDDVYDDAGKNVGEDVAEVAGDGVDANFYHHHNEKNNDDNNKVNKTPEAKHNFYCM